MILSLEGGFAPQASAQSQNQQAAASTRPTTRIVDWLKGHLHKIPETATEQGLPRTFKSLVEHVGDLQNKEYATALRELQSYFSQNGFFVGGNADTQALISLITDPSRREVALSSFKRDLAASGRKPTEIAKIEQSLDALVQVSEGLYNFREAQGIAVELTAGQNKDTCLASLKDKPISREISTYENPRTRMRDTITFLFPGDVPEVKKQTAILQFQGVWQQLRLYTQDKKCTVLFVHAAPGAPLVRSCAKMSEQPTVIVELAEEDYLGVTAHETIHAVFGAEGGHPYSNDFAEGCAMRLGAEFVPGSKANTPPEQVAKLLGSFVKNGELARSHSALLDRSKQAGAHVTEWEQESAKYVYGYFLLDALLRHPTYQTLYQKRANESGRLATFIHEVNTAYNTVGQLLTSANNTLPQNREVIDKALLQVGFTNTEAAEIIQTANASLRMFTAGLQQSS